MTKNRLLPKQSAPIPRDTPIEMRRFLESVQEQLDVGGGLRRGDPKHRWLRFSDLENAGLGRFNAALNGGEGGLEPPNNGGGNIVRPGTPQNFEVSGGYDWIHLRWDPGHGWPQTEIWRATDSDNIADAVRVGTVGNYGSQYPDHDVDYGVTYYYWVRFVKEDGIPQPFTPANGMPGAIVLHPPELLQQLEDRITSQQLSQDLNDYVEGIEVKADHANNQYTIKVGQNGAIAGFGLGFTSPNYNPTNPNHSIALFNVDTFAITHPGETSADQRLVFAVEDGNVVMDAAYITNLVVTDAVIQSVNVSKIVGNTASFVSANIEGASITSAQIAYQIFSDLWVLSGGTQGWMIDRAGGGYFNDIFARGNIQATSLEAGTAMVDTLNINGNAVTSPQYSTGSQILKSPGSSPSNIITSSTVTSKAGMNGVLIIGNVNISGEGGPTQADIRIKRNGSVSIGHSGTSEYDGETGSTAVIAFDSSPGINPYYTLEVSVPSAASASCRFRLPSMVVQAGYR
ncbi:hypothetical protein [uncultured Gilvimarinus sp.]|uniref:phage tail tip fiber protein n=1 Tax=uncultured Gilvimarinus sp. TaxID=1689143 RepID=UPI0030EC1939|tara:strand:+ start:4192 stop:5730 length:1539 start_codon:yes stop_codon:yes gene_type:complete